MASSNEHDVEEGRAGSPSASSQTQDVEPSSFAENNLLVGDGDVAAIGNTALSPTAAEVSSRMPRGNVEIFDDDAAPIHPLEMTQAILDAEIKRPGNENTSPPPPAGVEQIHDNVGPSLAPSIETMEDSTPEKHEALQKKMNELSPPNPQFNAAGCDDDDGMILKKIAADADAVAASPKTGKISAAAIEEEDDSSRLHVDRVEFQEDNPQNIFTASFPRTRNELPPSSEIVRNVDNSSRGDASQPQVTSQDHHAANSTNQANNNAIVDVEHGQNNNESLPRIPLAFLVEESDNNDGIITGYAEIIPVWWKQTRTKISCAIICLVVTASAIAVGVTLSREKAVADNTNSSVFTVVQASNAPSVSIKPTNEPTTVSPSSSFMPSSSPTSCANKILSTAQKIDLPFENASDPKLAVDGRNMVVVARHIPSASVYIIFYSLRGMKWERVNYITVNDEICEDDRLYSVALSGNSAFIGLPHVNSYDGAVYVFEQNRLGEWDKVKELYRFGWEGSAGLRFGSHVDIDRNLACASSNDDVQIFQRVNGKWLFTDKITASGCSSYPECFVGGNTIAIKTETSYDGLAQTISPRFTTYIPYLLLYKYDQDMKIMNPLQDFHFQSFGESFRYNDFDFISVDLNQDYLTFLGGQHKVFILHRQDASDEFSLLQNFSSSDCHDLAQDNDMVAVGGQNQTFIFSQGFDYNWEEALVLDQPFTSLQVSGRNLLVTANSPETGVDEVHYLSIDDCVQNVPTQLPSLSTLPSRELSIAPSAPPTVAPSTLPSSTAYPTQPPSESPSASPSMTAHPTQLPSFSTSPTETCYWVNVQISFNFWCGPYWEIFGIISLNGVPNALSWVEHLMSPYEVSGCLPEGEYEFTTSHDSEHVLKSCCHDGNSYNVASYGTVIAKGENCYKEKTTKFSLPFAPSLSPRPTSSTPPTPSSSVLPTTPFPTTWPPTRTTPFPTESRFNCPPSDFVGCTAVALLDFQDECSIPGEPCNNGKVGEFCCRDSCPRNYCTTGAWSWPTLSPAVTPLPLTPYPTEATTPWLSLESLPPWSPAVTPLPLTPYPTKATTPENPCASLNKKMCRKDEKCTWDDPVCSTN